MKQIKHINYGIACRIGNKIYINKNLKNYPILYDSILRHEKTHTDTFALRDIIIDLNIHELKGLKKQFYSFILTNPSSWIEFSPVCRYEGKWTINLLIATFYSLIILGGILVCLLP